MAGHGWFGVGACVTHATHEVKGHGGHGGDDDKYGGCVNGEGGVPRGRQHRARWGWHGGAGLVASGGGGEAVAMAIEADGGGRSRRMAMADEAAARKQARENSAPQTVTDPAPEAAM